MKPFSKYLLIISGIVLLFSTIFFMSENTTFTTDNFFTFYGVCFFVAVPFSLLFGIIFSLIKDTRDFGLALLAFAGISLLVGFGFCSQASVGGFH